MHNLKWKLSYTHISNFWLFIIFVGTNYSMKFIMMIIIMIDLETKEKNFTKISFKKYLKENSHCLSKTFQIRG